MCATSWGHFTGTELLTAMPRKLISLGLENPFLWVLMWGFGGAVPNQAGLNRLEGSSRLTSAASKKTCKSLEVEKKHLVHGCGEKEN